MTARPAPAPRATPDGKTLLRVTRDDCAAFGRAPVAFTLDLTGMEFFHSTVFESVDPRSYVALQGPPGGPLSVRVLAPDGDGDASLVALVQKYVYASSAESLRVGPAVDLIEGGRTLRALPFATADGPSWRAAPGGCALRVGPLVLLLEAEGFELSCDAVLAHPDLGPIARGFRLDEEAGE